MLDVFFGELIRNPSALFDAFGIPSILGLYADIGLVIAGIAGLFLILKGRK